MFAHTDKNKKFWRSSLLLLAALVLGLTGTVYSQTPTPTPDPHDGMVGSYRVTATTEIGYRWRSLTGSLEKYRSDLNYKAGIRSFDTNFLMETESGKGKLFDTLLVSNSGWGSDPNGFVRVNMEKTGYYDFTSTVRQITYFNNLINHVLNEHTQDTKNTLGDFDLKILPQNELIRFNLGGSFTHYKGTGLWTTRAYSDEFPVNADFNNRSNDMRVGAEGTLFGFDWGVTGGFRNFNERSHYFITTLNPGNNPANFAVINTLDRTFPVNGQSDFTQGTLHRMFGDRFDFTGKIIYAVTNTTSNMFELITGRDNSNNFVDSDTFTISGQAKRIQTRGDLGATWNVTDNFRISNTFSFDQFAINGAGAFDEALFRRNAIGNPLANSFTRTAGLRVDKYRRITNTIEADEQINNKIGFHIGYRFTHRNSTITGFDAQSLPTVTNTPISESEVNSTHSVLAGMKIKPTKFWAIFWDIEHGQADNVFTRNENYKYTNFRVRSNVNVKDLTFNVSGAIRNNENPSNDFITSLTIDYVTSIRSRFFSTSAEWNPRSRFSLGGGYTMRYITSHTPIILPVGSVQTQGTSDYFVRDHFVYIDGSVKPFSRLSLYGSYRFDRDKGQGSRVSSAIQFLIGSYPMDFTTPEFRAAFRINRYVDWDFGYQFYDYKDIQTPTQNYRAHLPYTSIRIYFGKDAGAR
ncbi:MAG: hypothetical protein JO053_16500 [Acidobacteria bacterium]|nr:hypothetical protein [Acidobacteriota bacterium]